MNVTVIYYLDVTSSWCYWAEPAWAELKQRYAKAPVEFSWKIAALDEAGLPKSKAEMEWFYRRSGTIVRSSFMLNPGWYDPKLKEYLAPNSVTVAAKLFGTTEDRKRLAIYHASHSESHTVSAA